MPVADGQSAPAERRFEPPPAEWLRAAIHAFLRSECDEAAMRVALGDAAPLDRDAPETEAPRPAGTRALQASFGTPYRVWRSRGAGSRPT